MDMKAVRGILTLVVALGLAMIACSFGGDEEGPPKNATVVEVVANSSLSSWISEVAETFNLEEVETSEGNAVYVQVIVNDAGQAISDIGSGEVLPDIWIPEEEVWVDILRDQGNDDFSGNCESLATSPLVIAMWEQAAESLGWPGLPLGWLDIGSLAADPTAWAYYSGGEFGDSLRLGHTHPGLSGSGASTLLALVQAAQSKTESVDVDDIEQPIVQASVSAFEAAVSWFSSNTKNLSTTMVERGNKFLGAAVMYENDVVENGDGALVPIYPLEGTFVATHPACINTASADETLEAAQIFRDYLLDVPSQEVALANGLRPANTSVSIGSPLDSVHGVDLDQPVLRFDSPSVETVYAAQDLWQSARKDVNLVMLLDVSGSMRGNKIDNMRDAAIQFVQQMGDDDIITIVAFSDSLPVIVNHQQVGLARAQITAAIDNLVAAGDTALYDAVGLGSTIIAETTTSETTNALVVLTDGQDTYSYRYAFDQSLMDMAASNDTTVFTIAYGEDADRDVLSQLAFGANGNFFLGDEASIAAIYDELSAAFGGSVGIGR